MPRLDDDFTRRLHTRLRVCSVVFLVLLAAHAVLMRYLRACAGTSSIRLADWCQRTLDYNDHPN